MRPLAWHTIVGGSRRYVDALLARLADRGRSRSSSRRRSRAIARDAAGVTIVADGREHRFDRVDRRDPRRHRARAARRADRRRAPRARRVPLQRATAPCCTPIARSCRAAPAAHAAWNYVADPRYRARRGHVLDDAAAGPARSRRTWSRSIRAASRAASLHEVDVRAPAVRSRRARRAGRARRGWAARTRTLRRRALRLRLSRGRHARRASRRAAPARRARGAEAARDVHSALYRGELVHARDDGTRAARFAIRSTWRRSISTSSPRSIASCGCSRTAARNLFAFHDRDYASRRRRARRPRRLRAARRARAPRTGCRAPHTTRLVTNLRAFGYVFNPVSFFLDYDAARRDRDRDRRGQQHVRRPPPLRARPARSASRSRGRVGFRHVRELFVSPFLHGERTYDFWFAAPLDGDRARDRDARHATDGPARVHRAVRRHAHAARPIARSRAAALRYPLMTAQVIGLIHWQALKLRLAGVPYRRPRADHRPIASVRSYARASPVFRDNVPADGRASHIR